jgi:hypothetical protein
MMQPPPQSFYIIDGDRKDGPYDLVSMIRKIKNDRLQAHQLVQSEEMEAPVAASHIPLFHEYFIEEEYAPLSQSKDAFGSKAGFSPAPTSEASSVAALLKQGWSHYAQQERYSMFVLAGVLVLLGIGVIFSSIMPAFLAIFLTCFATGAALSAFIMLLSIKYSQPELHKDAIISRISAPNSVTLHLLMGSIAMLCLGLPLLIASTLGLIGLLLFFIGWLGFSLCFLAPYHAVLPDTSAEPLSLVHASATGLLRGDKSVLMSLLIVQCLNPLALCLMVFPIVVSLPVTLFAWISALESHQHNI